MWVRINKRVIVNLKRTERIREGKRGFRLDFAGSRTVKVPEGSPAHPRIALFLAQTDLIHDRTIEGNDSIPLTHKTGG